MMALKKFMFKLLNTILVAPIVKYEAHEVDDLTEP